MITGSSIRAGDVLIGLPSTGLHTNGYPWRASCCSRSPGTRREPCSRKSGKHRRRAAEDPSQLSQADRALHDAGLLKGAAHITGGGITDNTPRILPKGLGARVHPGSWPVLPIFELLRRIGDIEEDDWRRTFNLGIGMIASSHPGI